MKRYLFLALICLLLALLTLALPYSKEILEGKILSTINGHKFSLAWMQLFIYIVIILISGFKKTILTALIGFILCSSFFLFFILLATTIKLDIQPYEHVLGKGYFISMSIAIVFWVLNIVNLIWKIRHSKTSNNSENPPFDN